jgi:hypothetical protein
MTFDQPIPANWPNKTCNRLKWAFPHALVKRASRTAKIKEVLHGAHDGKLPETFGSTVDDCWWWDVHQKGSAEIVLFLRKTPEGWREIRGVEGPTTASPAVLAQVRRIVRWLDQPREKRIATAKKHLRARTEPEVSTALTTLCLDAPETAIDLARAAHPPAWIVGDDFNLQGWCTGLMAAFSIQRIDPESRRGAP